MKIEKLYYNPKRTIKKVTLKAEKKITTMPITLLSLPRHVLLSYQQHYSLPN